MEDTISPDWRKSSYSGNGGGNCVEVGHDTGRVLVRDTKNRAGGTLSVPADAWREFAEELKRSLPLARQSARHPNAGWPGAAFATWLVVPPRPEDRAAVRVLNPSGAGTSKTRVIQPGALLQVPGQLLAVHRGQLLQVARPDKDFPVIKVVALGQLCQLLKAQNGSSLHLINTFVTHFAAFLGL